MSLSIDCSDNLIVPSGQGTLKYLQACVVPRRCLGSGLNSGDIVQVRFPDGSTFLCKLYSSHANECVVVSDVARRSTKETGALARDMVHLERIGRDPDEIISLELDVVLNERHILNLERFEDKEAFANMIRNICELFVLCEGYDIDLRAHKSTKSPWAAVKLEDIKANTGHRLGFVSPSTAVTVRNVRFLDTYTDQADDVSPGGLSAIRSSIEEEIRGHNKITGRYSNILLIGPSGSGKTLLVRSIAASLHANLFKLDHQVSQLPGENVLLTRIERIIRLSKLSNTPTIILIEDIEQFCPKRSGDKRLSSDISSHEMISGFDLLNKSGQTIVICTTRNVEAVNPKIRRPGRLDRELYIKVPNEEQRREIVTELLKEFQPTESDNLESLTDFITSRTPAFVGGDLVTLLKTALRVTGSGSINESGVERALLTVRPVTVLTNPYLIERDPSMTIASLGGLLKLKRTLDMSIFKPLAHPDRFLRFGLSLPKGILMYGPPGCAKTTVAKCLANEMNRHLIAVSAAQIYSPYVGDSEQLLAQLFHQARMCAPSIIFIDEIDSIVGCRSADQKRGNDVQTKLLSTLLIEMDGVGLKVQSNHNPENLILIIGATNRPDMIDDALMRPGRFDRLIYVPSPDQEERFDILCKITKAMPMAGDVDLRAISCRTGNYSGADLVNLCNETALAALSVDLSALEITMQDFMSTVDKLKPSLTSAQIKWYEDYHHNHDTVAAGM